MVRQNWGVFLNTSTVGTISVGAPVYYALGNYTTGVTIGIVTAMENRK